MLKGVDTQGRRRQTSQGAGWGWFESASCLGFPIPFAKEFSWLLPMQPHSEIDWRGAKEDAIQGEPYPGQNKEAICRKG